MDEKINKAGDLNIKAGDGGSHGKGGDVNLGPGTYKAGDVIQVNKVCNDKKPFINVTKTGHNLQ